MEQLTAKQKRKESEQGIWKSYFRLLFKAKLPWGWMIFLILLYLGNVTVTLMFPQFTQQIMAGDLSNSVVYGAVIVIVVGTIASGIIRYVGSLTMYKIDVSYRNLIWQRLMESPLSLFDKIKPNEMVSRTANDTSTISIILGSLIPSIIGSLYGMVGVIVQIYDYDWRLASGVLIYIPIVIGVNIWYGKWRFRTNKETYNRLSKLTQYLSERLMSIPLIKSFAMEDKEIDEGKGSLHYYYRAAFRRAVVNWIENPMQGILNLLQDMFVIGFGVYLVSNGTITIDVWIAFFMYVGMLWGILETFSLVYAHIKQSQGATSRIADLVEGDLEVYEKKISLTNTKQDIVFDRVGFSYDEKQQVLNNLSFTIPYGKVTAIVGPSGSGKSTIISLVQQFYSPTEGKITFGSQPISDIHLHEWRAMFSHVAQDSPLLSGTIRDNIMYGVEREVSESELKKAAQAANILEFIMDSPNGFDTEVGEDGGNLSGGQRQRITIARAFLRNTDFLLLDEAMASLDSKSEKAVEKAMDDLLVGRTAVVVAHDLATIIDADQIIVINESGTVDAIGTHNELLQSNELYRLFVQFLSKNS